MRALFQRLGVKPEAVLAGNLVPFRSPDWASLRNRQASLAFGKALWSRILQTASPNLIVTMGGEATDALTDILGISKMNRFPVGWGNITARRGFSDRGTLIGLPHLSRFGVMTRSQSSPYLDTLFDGAV
ncbi:hypothetical protein [Vannielia litorea]|uniref:hypothetical protein n=1 Tax=Vannielia litorea TaxID=1217970 RepID=UPI0039656AF7